MKTIWHWKRFVGLFVLVVVGGLICRVLLPDPASWIASFIFGSFSTTVYHGIWPLFSFEWND